MCRYRSVDVACHGTSIDRMENLLTESESKLVHIKRLLICHSHDGAKGVTSEMLYIVKPLQGKD